MELTPSGGAHSTAVICVHSINRLTLLASEGCAGDVLCILYPTISNLYTPIAL